MFALKSGKQIYGQPNEFRKGVTPASKCVCLNVCLSMFPVTAQLLWVHLCQKKRKIGSTYILTIIVFTINSLRLRFLTIAIFKLPYR